MPPKAVNRNVYEMTDEERKIFGIEKLPGSLREAAKEFQKDTFIQEILGEDLSRKYIEAKASEYQDYRIQITDWELENTCTYCNTDFAQKERAKEYLTGGGVSDRAYCCIPE